MNHYMIMVYQPDGTPPPPEVLDPIMEKVGRWRADLEAAGAWVFTGGLQPAGTATVLRASGGQIVMTDGPFAEGNEHLGGFTVIAVADLDEALAWSRQFAEITGLPVEVRPMYDGPDSTGGTASTGGTDSTGGTASTGGTDSTGA